MAQNPSSVIPLTTHALDTSTGLPADGLVISLYLQGENAWIPLSTGITNSDGRLPGLTKPGSITPGVYKMRFETGKYFANKNKKTFYPYVEVVFAIEDVNAHYHIPLLLSPYGYSTYRGS